MTNNAETGKLTPAEGSNTLYIDKLAKGESVEKEILIPFILVTTENVDEYLK